MPAVTLEPFDPERDQGLLERWLRAPDIPPRARPGSPADWRQPRFRVAIARAAHQLRCMSRFRAPWSRTLQVITLLATVLCLGLTIGLLWSGRAEQGLAAWAAWLPFALLLTCALFTVRGYAIGPDAIWIERLFWNTRLPLAGLDSAQADPAAMRGSIRVFGNGGFFSFSGWFRNRRLGAYRAWVTDPRHAVVLRYGTRVRVVSPEPPEEFIRSLAGCRQKGAAGR